MTYLERKLAKANREKDPESFEKVYEFEIVSMIRKKYTVNQELAILRQRDTKPDEYAEYNAYVEWCKSETKKNLEI